MPIFEAPAAVLQKTRNAEWCNKASGKSLGGPRELWGDYWRRFNTFQIPMFDEEEYFKTAIAIAEAATDEKDFEKLFTERNRQRHKELRILIGGIAHATLTEKNLFPCRAAKRAAIRVCQTGCFEYFLSLLTGNVLGWEADSAEDKFLRELSNNPPNNFREEMQKREDEEMQGSVDGDGSIPPLSPGCDTQIFSEYDWIYSLGSHEEWKREMEEERYGEERAGDIQEINSSDDDISTHGHRRRLLEKPATTRTSASHGSSSSHIAASKSTVEPTDGEHGHKRRRMESAATTPSPNSSTMKQATNEVSKKRSMPHGDDDSRGHKRRKTQSSAPTLPPNAFSSAQQAAVESSEKGTEKSPEKNTKKRSRSHGDDDGDDHEHKRRRTQSPTPTLPPNASSVPLATVENSEKSSKKRSRSDDVDNDHGNKRQKTQDPTPNMTPHVSSSPKQPTDGNALKKRPKVNGARKSRKQSSALNGTNATSANIEPRPLRRSARRSGRSTLQELDRSGQPRSIR